MKWKLFNSGKAPAEQNMTTDARLLSYLNEFKDPILHFYDWERDSATYGYFIKPEEHLNFGPDGKIKLDLARRPTGGGITVHLYDLAFSVLVPATHPAYSLNPMENYGFINSSVIAAVHAFTEGKQQPQLLEQEAAAEDSHCKHFCMAKPTKYDVMLNGQKVGGGAQRNTKKGFLHQGTITLALPPMNYLKEILLPGTCVLDAMQKNSCVLLSNSFTQKEMEEAKEHLQQLLIDAFKNKEINRSPC